MAACCSKGLHCYSPPRQLSLHVWCGSRRPPPPCRRCCTCVGPGHNSMLIQVCGRWANAPSCSSRSRQLRRRWFSWPASPPLGMLQGAGCAPSCGDALSTSSSRWVGWDLLTLLQCNRFMTGSVLDFGKPGKRRVPAGRDSAGWLPLTLGRSCTTPHGCTHPLLASRSARGFSRQLGLSRRAVSSISSNTSRYWVRLGTIRCGSRLGCLCGQRLGDGHTMGGCHAPHKCLLGGGCMQLYR